MPPQHIILTHFAPCIAGIKEGLYDNEALAAYLLYRLNALDSTSTFPCNKRSRLINRQSLMLLPDNRARISDASATRNNTD